MKVVLKLDQVGLKKPHHLKNNVFVIYSPKTVIIEPADSKKENTKIISHLPKEARAFVTTKFRGQEIQQVDKKTHRLWIEILNTSYFKRITIKTKTPLGFLVIAPENLKV